MPISSIGEFDLIEHLASLTGESRALVGIGDDAAVMDQGGPDLLLATVDMLVDNVHFQRDQEGASFIGEWAVTVNLSDVAAMGGRPLYALVSLALPPTLPIAWLESLYEGLTSRARAHGTSVIGGNIARTDGALVIDVAVLGTVAREHVVLRSGARPGDVLAITGALGTRAARRLLRERGLRVRDSDQDWLDRHAIPAARLESGQALARESAADAMIDVSDGLSSDLLHLCRASDVGAVLEADRLPIAPAVRRAAEALHLDPAELALNGGEDYELLVAVAPEKWRAAREATISAGLTAIGHCRPVDEGIKMLQGGATHPLPSGGWRHV